MIEKIYVVEEMWSYGDEGKMMHYTIDRKNVEHSFDLFEKGVKGDDIDDEFNEFDAEMIEDGYDYNQSSAAISSGTGGASYNEETWKANKEAFSSKEKGWVVENDESIFAFGSTKEQALLALATVDVGDGWD